MRKLSGISVVLCGLSVLTGALGSVRFARAELRPDKVHVADSKKSQSYIRDGLITGGDKAINEVVVRDIRRATNTGYERIVIDLEGTHNGEPAAIPRPPFYQVSVTPDEKRITFTIWGKPRLSFDSRRVVNTFKHSSVIQNIELLPRVEEKTWSFVFQLRGDNPVEVFELSNPVRIIMDVKGGGTAKIGKTQPPHFEEEEPVLPRRVNRKTKVSAQNKPKAQIHESTGAHESHEATEPHPAEKVEKAEKIEEEEHG